ncbi:UNVERIFIED_CONTAM: hypothetical protein Sindi_1962900 [Sesamum indicum]
MPNSVQKSNSFQCINYLGKSDPRVIVVEPFQVPGAKCRPRRRPSVFPGTMSSGSDSGSHSSPATISHRIEPGIPDEGPSRAKLGHKSRHPPRAVSGSDGAPTIAPESRPWENIVTTVRQQVHLIREKYHIPPSFEVVIPTPTDRMHRPPRGFCSLSLNHFDAGLRLLLAPYVSQILRRLELCPMQLSPNSIRHIVVFIIIMRVHHYEPSFDNFWSLYSFTTSARSTDSGFFYLSARKECRFLAPLTSNVGPWKKRFIFVRPPPGRGWPFCCEWVLEKPRPVVEGGGLEDDLIRSLSFYRYDPKKILVEEVLRLAHLSPAPIPVEGSLDDMVGQARLTQRIRAIRARSNAAVAAPAVPSSATSPHPVEGPIIPESSRPRSPPIEVGSEDTRSRTRSRVAQPGSGSPNRSRTDESEPGGLITRRRRRDKSPMEPNTRARAQPLAVGSSVSAAPGDRRGLEMLSDISECWRKAREDLRAPNHPTAARVGEKFVPDWNVSPNSSELYNATCLPFDQAALIQSLFTHLEEHAAHSLIQTANFVRSLSLKCAGFRRNQLVSERANVDMRIKVGEVTARAESLETQRAVLESRVKELEEKMASEILKATELGREAGFTAGCSTGKVEGREEFLNSDDFANRLREACIQGARDFLKAPAFDTALEIRAADYLVQGFERCKAQVSTLQGYVPDFDLSKLDPGVDGNMQPFPEEDSPPVGEDEFAVLLDEIENM